MTEFVITLAAAAAILVALFTLYLFLILPSPESAKKQFPTRLYTHRGLFSNTAGIPENSLKAFSLTKKKGYGTELDVHLTKDGQIIVFHDDDLFRMCGIHATPESMTYSELSSLRLLGTEERIPLFQEVLALLGGLPIICEIKASSGFGFSELCDKTAAAVRSYNAKYPIESGMCCVESFNPFVISYFRKHYSEITRGILSCSFKNEAGSLSAIKKFILGNMLLNLLAKPDFVAYKYEDRIKTAFRICKRLGCQTAAWTVKGKEAVQEALKEFNAVIFENNIMTHGL